MKQLVQQSVNQYLQSLEQGISQHPTIQEMKTHIDSLDHYLDGLTQAIKDRTEI
ncbi:hypothetical protein [Crocosphaera sp. Alani8]|uniref:hypothetical protein n=1 Tax=Crocosphaera sp. Alani8 TaxID=3038952 RepID=UPI00313DF562